MSARPPSGETREIVCASPSSVQAAEASETTSSGVAPTAVSLWTWPLVGIEKRRRVAGDARLLAGAAEHQECSHACTEEHERSPGGDGRRARPSARTLFRRGRREVELEFQAVDADGVRDALDAHSAAILVSEAVHLAGHQDDAVARQHLARARQRAEPGREVQSAAAEAVLCLHRFSRLEPDPHPHRQRGVLPDRVGEALLQGDRRAKSLAGRVEHAKRFVTSQLYRPAAAGADDLSRQLGEAGRQPRSLLVSSFARERRVPADVRDQKGANSRRAGYIVQLSQGAILVRGATFV